jgi:hypothetical protein
MSWLRLAFSHEWAEVILKKDGGDWVSSPRPWKLDRIAAEVANTIQVAGIRPEGKVRVIVFDFDRKPNAVSRYWHQAGESPELIRLQQEAERCGCQLTLLVSSASGGLHGVLTLPEGVSAWQAHWVGMKLLERSGIEPGQGQAEVFPSHMPYAPEGQAKVRSNGFRLPGQEGCKLIAAGNFIEDSEAIYQQLICDFELTENCDEWRFLVQESKERRDKSKYLKASKVKKIFKVGGGATGVKWTAAGQSQQNLARITTWARQKYPNLDCAQSLGAVIRQTVLNTEGFNEFASEQTKKDVMRENGGICERWARSSLRRSWGKAKAVTEEKVGGDKRHNERLYKQSRAKLTRIWKQFKNAAELSKRAVAKAAGVTRSTLEKHWGYWLQLVAHTQGNNGGCLGVAACGPGEGLGARAHLLDVTDKKYVFVDEVGMFVDISTILSRSRQKDLQVKTGASATQRPGTNQRGLICKLLR